LQLLTRRHDAPPSETWGQDVARLLSGSFETESARRLQNVLKVLLRR
jgi:ATP-dependent RNA helicase SUPV3L1/SUV3